MRTLVHRAAAAVAAFTVSMAAWPCTTFVCDGERGPLFGRNYDFEFGEALVVLNPRGLERTSAAPPAAGQAAARWVSSYGSLTFNQFGIGYPTGGMNEKGLVVELLWLDGSRYPDPDGRPVVTTLEFIQHMLDRAATLDEALAAARAFRIAGRTPLHFLVSDRQGRTATLEFLDGQLVVHAGDALPVRALANDRYDTSLAALRGSHAAAAGGSSLSRFTRAARQSAGARSVADAFRVLDDVAQPGATHWQIVYEPAAGALQWRTSANAALRRLELGGMGFDCRADGVRLLGVSEGQGDVRRRFRPYGPEADEAQLRVAYGKVSFFHGDAARQAAADAAAAQSRMRCA